MMISSFISAVILGLVCLIFDQALIPKHEMGWVWVACVGLISQLLGQGLVAKTLAILPVGQSALLLLWAPISAAIFGWVIFDEAMTAGQSLSMAIMVFGISIVAKR
jgi:drug/metabolite transporter (DMT)-like permease